MAIVTASPRKVAPKANAATTETPVVIVKVRLNPKRGIATA